MREFLGYTGHHPRWALAYKFDAPEAQTVVKAIDVQVGRTGRVTPVARVEKVKVGNSMVSNVTLHNQDYIEMLELAIGDTVAISKRGDVIPAIERVVEKNEEGATTWIMPDRCPSCNTMLIRDGAHQFCPNSDCPDQVLGRISFFVGREQMDIDGMGPETVAYLYRKGLLHDIPDIYRIDYRNLIGEPGFGERKVQSLDQAVQASRQRPFRTVLVSLGIPDFGKKAVDLLLASGITRMQQLLEMVDTHKTEPLLQIKGFGEKTVNALFTWLSDTRMRSRIAALAEIGLQMAQHDEQQATQLPQQFSGQVWCVTGSFTRFSPRTLALQEIEARGGRTVSSVTGKTTHLLAGTGAGSKLQQAAKLGVTIVSEEDFLSMLGGKVRWIIEQKN
jgi:DNA ligase (NAD+)